MSHQKGLVHILVVIILLAGLLATLYLSQYTQIFKPKAYSLSAPIIPTPTPLYPTQAATTTFNKKVLAIVFDPTLRNGRKLTADRSWSNPSRLFNQLIEGLRRSSNSRVNYTIAQRIDLGWTRLTDGFSYDESTYFDVLTRPSSAHDPQGVNFEELFATYDVCGKLNRGEIDELWVMGGPWFGFPEARLAGPGAFAYNDEPLNAPSCTKLIPIMGFNYERGLAEMYEDFAHRIERTMQHVYSSWSRDEDHAWNKFSLLATDRPDLGRGGCGNAHLAVNAAPGAEYDRTNTRTVISYCDDFLNYPNLTGRTSSVSCNAWGCPSCESAACDSDSTVRYFEWWFSHLPHFQGRGPDGKLNDWFSYVFDPNSHFLPREGTFSNLSVSSSSDTVSFSFDYSGVSPKYYIDASLSPDMSEDVFIKLAEGNASPLRHSNPRRWDQYACGRTLYWRVYNHDRSVQTPIQTMVVCSSSTPSIYTTP